MLYVKVINTGKNALPKYQTTESAGMDLMANIKDDIVLKPFERVLIGTGLYFEPVKDGNLYEAQIRSRSGLAYKHGIICVDTPGTIDSDYRGEIHVALINLSTEDFTITPGMRIAQVVFNKVERAEWIVTDKLSETTRGAGGFGSTGI